MINTEALKTAARHTRWAQLSALMKTREAGATVLIADFDNIKYVNDYPESDAHRNGFYFFKEGDKPVALRILSAQGWQNFTAFQHDAMKASGWFKPFQAPAEKASFADSIQARHPDFLPSGFEGFAIPYGKFLGVNGVNKAVDPIFIVREKDGSYKVLSIKRPDGTIAFPGGMQEALVKNTMVNELIEEFCSGDLLSPEAESGQIFDRMAPTLVADAKALLADKKNKGLAEKEADFFQRIFSQTDTGSKHSESLYRMLAVIAQRAAEEGAAGPELKHFIVQLKTHLYQKYFPLAFTSFKKAIEDELTQGDCIPNISDPRNTDGAWMETTPCYGLIDMQKLSDIFEAAHLNMAKAGDDAVGAGFVSLSEFNQGNPYSDHGAILLETIGKLIEKTPALAGDSNLEAALEAIPAYKAQRDVLAQPAATAATARTRESAPAASSGAQSAPAPRFS